MSFTFTFADNGTSSAIKVDNYKGKGALFTFTAYYYGTFNSATVKLQASANNGTTYVDIPNSSSTSATVINMEIRATHIRAVVSGGSSPSLTVAIL